MARTIGEGAFREGKFGGATLAQVEGLVIHHKYTVYAPADARGIRLRVVGTYLGLGPHGHYMQDAFGHMVTLTDIQEFEEIVEP